MVNFYSAYIHPAAARQNMERMQHEKGLKSKSAEDDHQIRSELKKWDVTHPIPHGSIHNVLDHMEHIIRVAGIDHVGLGTDFDGIDLVPDQLEDVSAFPRITQGWIEATTSRRFARCWERISCVSSGRRRR